MKPTNSKLAPLLTALICLVLAFAALGCDGPKLEQPISAEQQERWDELKEDLEDSSPKRRVAMLEAFVAESSNHTSYLSEARGLLVVAKETKTRWDARHEAIERVAVAHEQSLHTDRAASLAKEGLESLTLVAMTHTIRTWRNLLTTPKFEGDTTYTLPDSRGGWRKFDAPIRLDFGRLRASVRDTLNVQMGAELADDCVERCLDQAINEELEQRVGGPLFLGAGRVDPERLDAIAEALWVEPDHEILGVPAAHYYRVMSDLPRDLITLRIAIASHDEKKTVKRYRELRAVETGPYSRKLQVFYFAEPRNSGIMQELQPGVDPGRIHVPYGFWMRRIFDGSEPIVMKWLTRTLKTYDPEFWEGLEGKARL